MVVEPVVSTSSPRMQTSACCWTTKRSLYDINFRISKLTILVDDFTRSDIVEEHEIHFHMDADLGSLALISNTFRKKTTGIERADSVTIDGNKQLFVLKGSGVLLLTNLDQKPIYGQDRKLHHSERIFGRLLFHFGRVQANKRLLDAREHEVLWIRRS